MSTDDDDDVDSVRRPIQHFAENFLFESSNPRSRTASCVGGCFNGDDSFVDGNDNADKKSNGSVAKVDKLQTNRTVRVK
jgi:hypothetical protein